MGLVQTAETGGCFLSTTPDTIFTPEAFSGDEKLMIEAAEDFCCNKVLPIADRLDKQEEGLMPALIREAGQLGFCGIDAPEAYGGLGLGKNIAARILEHLSLDASFSVTLGVTSGISQFGLIAYGNEDQKSQYLPRLTSGEWIGAYCLSEPNAGSDALSMTTKAEDKGDHWLLNGTKMWISNAKWAKYFIVMAKVDGTQVSAFLVEKDFPGVSIGREEHKLGLKASSTARVLLENARVPKENLLHIAGKGHYVAFNALNMGRFKLSSMSIGPARLAMGEAAKYALDRRQFNTPIAEFGLIRQKFADMAASFFAAESMIYRTGANIDHAFHGADSTIEGQQSAAEAYSIECSACKVFSTEAEARIVDDALQVYGGYGFTEEFPLARIYRDARISRIYEGTNEINRLFIADRMVRRAEAGLLKLDSDGSSFISDLTAKAFRHYEKVQEVQGAISDLVILAYAEQSARLRAKQVGGLAQSAYERFVNGANAKAAEIYGRLTGEPVSIPAPKPDHTDELAEGVYAKHSPLAF